MAPKKLSNALAAKLRCNSGEMAGAIDDQEWRTFTPPEIDPQRCFARTWNAGQGGQCQKRQNRMEDRSSKLCTTHLKNGASHGLVDGPIPAAKLAEFQAQAALFAVSAMKGSSAGKSSEQSQSELVSDGISPRGVKRQRATARTRKHSRGATCESTQTSSSSSSSESSSSSKPQIPSQEMRPVSDITNGIVVRPSGVKELVSLMKSLPASDVDAKLSSIRSLPSHASDVVKFVRAGGLGVVTAWLETSESSLTKSGQPQIMLDILDWLADKSFTKEQLYSSKLPRLLKRVKDRCSFARDHALKVIAAWRVLFAQQLSADSQKMSIPRESESLGRSSGSSKSARKPSLASDIDAARNKRQRQSSHTTRIPEAIRSGSTGAPDLTTEQVPSGRDAAVFELLGEIEALDQILESLPATAVEACCWV